MTYNLDKQNGVGFHFGQIPPTDINKDNVKTKKSFYGFNYAYAFDCINVIHFVILTMVVQLLQTMVRLLILDGIKCCWRILGILKMILVLYWVLALIFKKAKVKIKSDKGGKDADERMEKSFPAFSTILFVGYSFKGSLPSERQSR